MSNHDGGPAFPVDRGIVERAGMSLLDWFAGRALAEMAGRYHRNDYSVLARDAYAVAEAMIAERQRRNGG